MMNSMGSFEHHSDKHPLHDRVEELERENKLLKDALYDLTCKGEFDTDEAYFALNRAFELLATVGEK